MQEIWNWILSNWAGLATLLVIALALAWKYSQGKALEFVWQIIAVIGSAAKDALGEIPEVQIEAWAIMFYGKLPGLVKLLISEQAFAETVLAKWRWFLEQLDTEGNTLSSYL